MRCKTLKESRKTLDINEEDKDDEKGEEHINDEDNDQNRCCELTLYNGIEKLKCFSKLFTICMQISGNMYTYILYLQ